MSVAGLVAAQEAPIELSGLVDGYYSYNLNTPSKPCRAVAGIAVFNCLRSFDVAHNSFSLSLLELAVEKRTTVEHRVGFRVDVAYGPATTIVHQAEPGGRGPYQNVLQAYFSVLTPIGSGLRFDVGK